MMKKFFALASMTAVAGVIAAGAMVGCSSSDDATPGTTDDAGTADAKADAKKDSGGNQVDGSVTPTVEEETVGKPCSADSDCEVADSVGDNVCSKGYLATQAGDIVDLFPTPVCIQSCGPINQAKVDDSYFCDGNAGVCFNFGIPLCTGGCQFTSDAITVDCQGANNKCQAYLFGDDGSGGPAIIGACTGACTKDSDCAGTPGQKCQKEQGICQAANLVVEYTTPQGSPCTENADAAANTCLCATLGGTGANKDKGYCYSQCVTGTTGACGTGWQCSSHIPTQLDLQDGGVQPWMTKVPTGVVGSCSLPCDTTADCLANDAFKDMTADTQVTCTQYADGKFCDLVTQN